MVQSPSLFRLGFLVGWNWENLDLQWGVTHFQTFSLGDFKKGRRWIKDFFVFYIEDPFLNQKGQPFLFHSWLGKSLEGVVGCDFCCVLTLSLYQPVLGNAGWKNWGEKGFLLLPQSLLVVYLRQNQALGTTTDFKLKFHSQTWSGKQSNNKAKWWELPLDWLIPLILVA